ncbi:HAD family phosphatase [Marinobacter sp. 2_MG-2023]|uniref:HAD family hydrolase n=1 Tax=Marinobacter sp. 2_MG-2023 TaxID=3062679 RepID=UPI0026E2424A|nr:HAD family hydrolase [Marinobacter sp. 2_MG-2023]MDO6443404.1 HAD family hydrolase [Marinobacter sp. 2_MG-2023]
MLAIFDLDETLIRGDSSQLFTEFLRAENIDASPDSEARGRVFMQAYNNGHMDLQDYMEFSLAPIRGWQRNQVQELIDQFVTEVIPPRILTTGQERVAWHKAQGHDVLIISATGEHLVSPIARHLGIDDGIGVQVEWQNDSLKGTIGSRRPFRDGKVSALEEWITARQASPEKVWFYSDSHNDLPLLNAVDYPVAVNPDPILEDYALQQGWLIFIDEVAQS